MLCKRHGQSNELHSFYCCSLANFVWSFYFLFFTLHFVCRLSSGGAGRWVRRCKIRWRLPIVSFACLRQSAWKCVEKLSWMVRYSKCETIDVWTVQKWKFTFHVSRFSAVASWENRTIDASRQKCVRAIELLHICTCKRKCVFEQMREEFMVVGRWMLPRKSGSRWTIDERLWWMNSLNLLFAVCNQSTCGTVEPGKKMAKRKCSM